MGMPEVVLGDGVYDFVKNLVEKHGEELDGKGYEVTLADGSQEVVVLGVESLYGSDRVVDGFSKLLAGGGLFAELNEDKGGISDVPPDTSLKDFFSGGARLPNALKRGGIHTVGELLTLMGSPDYETRLWGMRDIGAASIAQIREKLGLE